MKNLTYIQGAMVLSITNLVTGSLSFYFRIYFSKHVGAEGVGVYQLVLPLYMLAITLVSGGITTALSKIIAEYHARRQMAAIGKTLKICFIAMTLWSVVLCTFVAFHAEFIASFVLKDGRTSMSIIVLTPAVFFISISAIFRGYFYGIQEIGFPAGIDIIEKVIRLAGMILITDRLMIYGIAFACAGAMAAMTAGELMSTLLLFLIYLWKKPRLSKQPSMSSLSIMKKMLGLAVPLSLGGALSTIMDMISAILIPERLQLAGYNSAAALSGYGEITGMVMPLINYPGIVVFALTTTLIPAITQSHIGNNYGALNKKCQDSLVIAWSIGLLTTVFCVSFPEELCRTLFNRPEAGKLLFWTGLGSAFYYLYMIQSAILNGLGLQREVFNNIIFDLLINVACIYLLMPIPWIGIYGYVAGFFISGIVIVIRNIRIFNRLDYIRIRYDKVLLKPILPFWVMFLTIKLINFLLLSMGFAYNMIFSGIIGIIALVISLLWNNVFTADQIKKTLLLQKSYNSR